MARGHNSLCSALGMAVAAASFHGVAAFTPLRVVRSHIPRDGKGLMMKADTVKLGPNLEVSHLGVGTWAWGDDIFWKYSKKEDEELRRTFDLCYSNGVNLFDTAEVYGFGRSEELCGSFHNAYEQSSTSSRGQLPIALATKFAPYPWRLGAGSVVDACRASLKRLGKKDMALNQIHWWNLWRNEAYWDGLAECYEQGLVKAVGVSNYGPDALRRAHQKLSARGVPLVSNQVQYSLLHRNPETDGVKAVCDELGIRILAYSPLAQGLLTGKYSRDNLPQGPRSRIFAAIVEDAEPLLKRVQQLARAKNKTPSQIALNWVICKGAIPIPGARNLKQAQDNIKALGWRLTAKEVSELDSTAANTPTSMISMPLTSP